jgi:hypothetical protein
VTDVEEVTMVRDEDISKRFVRRLKRRDRNGRQIEYTEAQLQIIVAAVDASPTLWTPRLVYEEIRATGRHDISEDLVRNVMNAMQHTDLPN